MAVQIPGPDASYNVGDELVRRCEARAAAPVLRCEGQTLSGGQLAERALALQGTLEARGLAPGDRVLMLQRDTPAFHAAFLGALRGGFVPVPISTLLPARDVRFIAHDAGVRAALIDDALPAPLRDPALLPSGAVRLGVRGSDIEGASLADTAPPAAPSRAREPAFWLYTSGTTGEPKGVIHRHLDVPVTVAAYAEQVLGLRASDRLLSAAKLFFAYGLGNALTFPLYTGAEVVLHPERPTPEAMFDLLLEQSPSVFFGVPTLYAGMLASPALPAALPALRLCVSAGEALPPALFRAWRERFGLEILDGLGSTEMLHIFLSNRPGRARPGSSGTPVPGYQVRIVDDAGADQPQDRVGALLAGGASAALAYHDRPDQTARTMISPGWLRTGDSYRRDADGFYYHVGRSDDLLKVSGQWVSPVEVEAALAEHPSVLESGVVGATDDDDLVRPKAFVVLKPGSEPSEGLAAELQGFVKARLTPHKYPRWVVFVDSLPKTATGKIQRHELRKGGPS